MPTVEELLQVTTVTKSLPGKSVPRRLETGLFSRGGAMHSICTLLAKGNRMQVGWGGGLSVGHSKTKPKMPKTETNQPCFTYNEIIPM